MDTHNSQTTPSRILYSMIRVGDLERSISFYQDILGMHELRREKFTEGRFTLCFLGYGEEAAETVLELTYNWDETAYQHGTGYGHLALEVSDLRAVCDRLEKHGVRILRAPGPMLYAPDETGHRENIAFLQDPDGYRIELVEAAAASGR